MIGIDFDNSSKHMKYFIDTEFIEGFHKPWLGKRRHYIDLISIGIVREDGGSYHAISSEYDYNSADQWVRENVIAPLYQQFVHGDARNRLAVHNFHKVLGSPLSVIKEQVLDCFGCWRDVLFWRAPLIPPEIYGYYADYDWVLFCSLFGRMLNLPKGFPVYCRDLKQMEDETADKINPALWGKPDAMTLEQKIDLLKSHSAYPKQSNEHNALDDAKWNKRLFEYLNGTKFAL